MLIDLHSGESRFKNDNEEAIAKIDIGSRVPDSSGYSCRC